MGSLPHAKTDVPFSVVGLHHVGDQAKDDGTSIVDRVVKVLLVKCRGQISAREKTDEKLVSLHIHQLFRGSAVGEHVVDLIDGGAEVHSEGEEIVLGVVIDSAFYLDEDVNSVDYQVRPGNVYELNRVLESLRHLNELVQIVVCDVAILKQGGDFDHSLSH